MGTGKAFCSDMSVLSCMSMSNCQIDASKTFGIRVLKPVVAVSHCHHPPSTLLHIHRDWVAISTEWQPLQFTAASSLRASRSLSASQRECKPSWCHDYSEFPLAVVNSFLKQQRKRSSGSLQWIVASQEASVKSLELTSSCSNQMLSA